MDQVLPSFRSPESALLPYDGQVALYQSVFAEPDELFIRLRECLKWEQKQVVVFNRRHNEPRLSAWYGDPDAVYAYSGMSLSPIPWVEPLVAIKEKSEALTSSKFNSVLANFYRNGDDSMGWHSDDEPELGPHPTIASVSFGAERRFDFRHRRTKEKISVLLPHGSVLVMSGTTQSYWQHAIAKTKRISDPRINLTYRLVTPELSRG